MTNKNLKAKIIAGSFILFVLFVAGYFIVSKLIKPSMQLEKSIAVLLFENWNSDEEYIHLGDAITDEIILQLQNMNEFDRVLSRSSTMQFKDNRPTIPEIAEKLGVNYIIEGSIQRQKDNVTIRVQVIRAKHEDHVWGDKYDGKWEEILN
jgi:adenylate cyclase